MFTSITAVLGIAAPAMLLMCSSLMIAPVYAFGPQVTVGSAAEQVLDGRTAIAVDPAVDMGDDADGIVAKVTKIFDSLPGHIGAALALFVALNILIAMTPAQVDPDRQRHHETSDLPLDGHEEEQERRRNIDSRNEGSIVAPPIEKRSIPLGHGPRFTSAR